VYTDGWLAYCNIQDLGYAHRVIEHVHGFVHGTWTNNHIEHAWREIEQLLCFAQKGKIFRIL